MDLDIQIPSMKPRGTGNRQLFVLGLSLSSITSVSFLPDRGRRGQVAVLTKEKVVDQWDICQFTFVVFPAAEQNIGIESPAIMRRRGERIS